MSFCKNQSAIYYQFYASPIGNLLLIANHRGLIGIEFEQEQLATSITHWQLADTSPSPMAVIFEQTTQLLDDYFSGKAPDFSQLPFLSPIGTPFQQAVWKLLREIPYGQTSTYGELAEQLGKPNAMRAVGNAVGRNPISILIPCHRVLGKNQTLTGFGGGLPAKRYLLDLEEISYQNRGVEFVNPKHKNWEMGKK